MKENIDPFSVHLKGNEFGIDGCGIIVQGSLVRNIDDVSASAQQIREGDVEFVFVQSKSSSKFGYGEISKFIDAVFDFFEGGMEGESGQLDELIEAKDRIYQEPLRKNPKLYCLFASTGNFTGSPRTEKLLVDSWQRFVDKGSTRLLQSGNELQFPGL